MYFILTTRMKRMEYFLRFQSKNRSINLETKNHNYKNNLFVKSMVQIIRFYLKIKNIKMCKKLHFNVHISKIYPSHKHEKFSLVHNF